MPRSYSPLNKVVLVAALFTGVILPGPHMANGTVSFHSCVLLSRGAVSCWGRNDFGQTGNLTMTIQATSYADVPDPIIVPGLSSGILSIGAGGYHSCAVIQGATAAAGASAVCWGKNSEGQLGIGSNSPTFNSSPLPVLGLDSGVASLAAGFEHTCARMINGTVYCWGDNVNGQIGQGYLSIRASPITVPSLVAGLPPRAIQIAVGGYHSCALLDDGAVFCWGRCLDAEIGDNTPVCTSPSVGKPSPSAVYGLGAGSGIIKISTGNSHSCGVMSNGSTVCWGTNSYGELGDNTVTSISTRRLVPGFVVGVSDAVAISCGFCHTCIIRSNGQPMCWGCNTNGQLGNGVSGGYTLSCTKRTAQNVCLTTTGSSCGSTSVGVTCSSSNCCNNCGCSQILDSDIVAIAAGRENTCARRRTGALLCWGSNVDKEITSACSSARCRLPLQISLSAQVLEVWDQPALSSVFAVAFNVSEADRMPGKTNVSITFAFTTQTVIHSGGSITLNYPPEFFVPDVLPSSANSNVQGLAFSLQSTSSTSLLLLLADQLPSSSNVIITLHGLSIGAVTEGSAEGVSIQTSSDVAVSRAVPSGAITSRVLSVAFSMATADRIAGNMNATVTLSFTPMLGVDDGKFITMHYPQAFFSPGVRPFVSASEPPLSTDNFLFELTSNTSFIFQLNGASLISYAPVILTICGLTIGAATDGSPTGIIVQTSLDKGLSHPVDSGPIFMSLVPVAVSAYPLSPLAGESLTVFGHSFILPDISFNCTAMIGPVSSSGTPATCVLLTSSRALVHVPNNVLIAPSFVQLHFEPGNVTTTAITRLCPCAQSSGGTACGCALRADSCAARIN